MRPLEQVLWQAFTWFGLLVLVLMLLALPLYYNSGKAESLIPITGEVQTVPAAGPADSCEADTQGRFDLCRNDG